MIHQAVSDVLNIWQAKHSFTVPGYINLKRWYPSINLGKGNSITVVVENACAISYNIRGEDFLDVGRNSFTYQKIASINLSPTLKGFYPLDYDLKKMNDFLTDFDASFYANHERFNRGVTENFTADLP
ncbi:MAG: hypothetical protein WC176_10675 [Candidatus Cloacimonadaceae bacterium]